MKLEEWLKKRGVKIGWVVKSVGTSYATLHRIIKDDKKQPKLKLLVALSKVTDGEVSPKDYGYEE
jgi:hypothetical protein